MSGSALLLAASRVWKFLADLATGPLPNLLIGLGVACLVVALARRIKWKGHPVPEFEGRAAIASLGASLLLLGVGLHVYDSMVKPPNRDATATATLPSPPATSMVWPPCTDELEKSPEEIWAKYEHNCVRWTLPLKGIEPRSKDGQTVQVNLAAGRLGLLTVAARVSLS